MRRSTYVHARTWQQPDGQYIWTPALKVNEPSTIAGHPVMHCEEVPHGMIFVTDEHDCLLSVIDVEAHCAQQ